MSRACAGSLSARPSPMIFSIAVGIYMGTVRMGEHFFPASRWF
jgi:hypothetical protein